MGCECIYGSNISTNASLYKHRHAYPQRDANAQQQVNSQRESIRASSRTVKLSARPSARASCLAASIARRFWLVFTCCRDKLGCGIGEGLEACARFSTSSTPPGFSRSHRNMRCASESPPLGPRCIHFVERAKAARRVVRRSPEEPTSPPAGSPEPAAAVAPPPEGFFRPGRFLPRRPRRRLWWERR